MVIIKLTNAASVFAMLIMRASAIHVGDCYNEGTCSDRILSVVSGGLNPNDEYKITGSCPAFLSDTGSPNKVDLCTNTKCTRLIKDTCYSQGPYVSVEVLP